MSYIRILNEAGNDVLRIDLGTGRVEVLRPKEIGDAARAWWDAVETIARATTSEAAPRYRDLVFKDVGESGHARPHGDLIIQPGLAAPPMPEGSGGSMVVKIDAMPHQRLLDGAGHLATSQGPDEDFDAMSHQRLLDRADHLRGEDEGSRDESKPAPGWEQAGDTEWYRRPLQVRGTARTWQKYDAEHGTTRADRSVAQLCLAWADALRQNPTWRNGQALFNALTQVLPAVAEEVRGSSIDPFHNNRTMANVLAFVLMRLADPREKPGGERTSASLKAARDAAVEWNADAAQGSTLVATVAADVLPEATQLAGGGWAIYFRAKRIDESERACRAALARLCEPGTSDP